MPEKHEKANINDPVYYYSDVNVLKNKLNIKDGKELSKAERELTVKRLVELAENPLPGLFDFHYLKSLHHYIFQDLYDWAGKTREVEIGKGNLFCPVENINSYAETVFSEYYKKCKAAQSDKNEFVKTFSEQYGNLNALHPFREGNGRTQREFARIVCLNCGYDLSFRGITQKEMINASIKSFFGDNSYFESIFSKALSPIQEKMKENNKDPFEPIESDVVR